MTSGQTAQLKWFGAALALLVAGVGVGFWWARSSMAPAETAAAPGAAAASERRILYWQDPMHPGQRFDKPGKSPYMDMDLEPVYADEEGASTGVRIDPNVVQNLGIRVGKVERMTWPARLKAVGNVAFDERALELVQARVEGYVTRLYVKAPLEHVRRGQPLADILAPQWIEAQEEYLALLDASSASARSLRDAARQRLVVLDVPEATIRSVETTRKTSGTTTVTAPIDGVVTELGVREGAAFMPGATLFRVNGLATVWVNAEIPEAKVSMSPLGSKVLATALAWPGETFAGEVIDVLPQVDPETRTLTARVSLRNSGGKLAPGMYVTLEILGPEGPPRLVVPSEAVIVTGERSVVILAEDGGTFRPVNVTPGAEQGGKTEILSGLSAEQSIVLSGQFLIDSEANLRAATERLGAGSPQPGEHAEHQP